MDRAEYGTNRPYYRDIIQFWSNPYKLDPAKLKHFYIDKGFSAKQVATLIGISKSTVLGQLHRMGINPVTKNDRATNPENYRLANPPYGFRVVNGRLLPNRSELRTSRLIINLLRDKGLSATSAAKELERRCIRNRRGAIKWGHWTVQGIFNRWKNNI